MLKDYTLKMELLSKDHCDKPLDGLVKVLVDLKIPEDSKECLFILVTVRI